MIRLLTAGESHGKGLVAILEGLPAGLPVDPDFIDRQLHRRQLGYGRGGRMSIEADRIEILSGVRHGRCLGSPVSFLIPNKDWENWSAAMSVKPAPEGSDLRPVTRPRPGHADLAGALKLGVYDMRDVLERASARETAARVAAGAFCLMMLGHFGMRVGSHVLAVGGEHAASEDLPAERIFAIDPESPVRCADPDAARRIIERIDAANKAGDSLGGTVEAVASGVPAGLGSHAQWDRRLDGEIAQALMSVPSAKAVEIGNGIASAHLPGSAVHDEIFYDGSARRFRRGSNRAGGIEGGISNGCEIRVRVFFKPIPTLRSPLRSVDVRTKEPFEAAFERTDCCVVPAAGVVVEAMLGLVLARAFLEKFGGDSLKEVEGNYARYSSMLDSY